MSRTTIEPTHYRSRYGTFPTRCDIETQKVLKQITACKAIDFEDIAPLLKDLNSTHLEQLSSTIPIYKKVLADEGRDFGVIALSKLIDSIADSVKKTSSYRR
jgi:hypothetical protein